MSASIFDNKLILPNELMLQEELGDTYQYLEQVKSEITKASGGVTPEWKHYGQKSGWTLKLYAKKRNILFVTPCHGFFLASLVFGDRAVDAIIQSTLPDSIKQEVFAAPKYAEGRGIRLEVNSQEQCGVLLELIRVKIMF